MMIYEKAPQGYSFAIEQWDDGLANITVFGPEGTVHAQLISDVEDARGRALDEIQSFCEDDDAAGAIYNGDTPLYG